MWHHKEFDPVVLALWPDGYIARQAQSSLIQAPQKEPLFHHQRLLQFRFAPDKDVRFGGHFFFYLSLNWTSLFLFKKPGKTSFIIILLYCFNFANVVTFSESRMDALRNNKQRCDQLRVVYLNDQACKDEEVSQLTLLVNIRWSNK